MHRIVVETDRDPTQYDQTGPINVRPSLPLPTLTNISASVDALSCNCEPPGPLPLPSHLYQDPSPPLALPRPGCGRLWPRARSGQLARHARGRSHVDPASAVGVHQAVRTAGRRQEAHSPRREDEEGAFDSFSFGPKRTKLIRVVSGQIFAGQEKVPFHHLPEYVNRFLTPPPPVVIEYSIPCVSLRCATTTTS